MTGSPGNISLSEFYALILQQLKTVKKIGGCVCVLWE